jgi:hypothetical protein
VKKKRFSAEQMVAILKQADGGVAGRGKVRRRGWVFGLFDFAFNTFVIKATIPVTMFRYVNACSPVIAMPTKGRLQAEPLITRSLSWVEI